MPLPAAASSRCMLPPAVPPDKSTGESGWHRARSVGLRDVVIRSAVLPSSARSKACGATVQEVTPDRPTDRKSPRVRAATDRVSGVRLGYRKSVSQPVCCQFIVIVLGALLLIFLGGRLIFRSIVAASAWRRVCLAADSNPAMSYL